MTPDPSEETDLDQSPLSRLLDRPTEHLVMGAAWLAFAVAGAALVRALWLVVW